MTPRLRSLLLVGLVLLLGACSTIRGEATLDNWVESPETTPALDEAAAAGTGVPIDPDTPAPTAFAFRSTSLDGSLVDGAELFDRRPLIVSFVVPTCTFCVTEGPELAAAAARHPDATFVVVHSNGSEDAYHDFVELSGLDGEGIVHLRDDDATLWSRFGVVSQPSSVLVDGDGLVRRVDGALGEDGFDRAADLVLGRADG